MLSEFITQNVLWVGAFVLVANLLIFSFMQGSVKGVGSVSALHLPQLQRGGKSVIVDVNEPAAFAASHIPGSVNHPLSTINAENPALRKIKDKTTIIVCQTGSVSTKAAKQLLAMGHQDLHILKGGMAGWTKENLPVTTGKESV